MLDLLKNMSVSNVAHFKGISEGYFVLQIIIIIAQQDPNPS